MTAGGVRLLLSGSTVLRQESAKESLHLRPPEGLADFRPMTKGCKYGTLWIIESELSQPPISKHTSFILRHMKASLILIHGRMSMRKTTCSSHTNQWSVPDLMRVSYGLKVPVIQQVTNSARQLPTRWHEMGALPH